VLAPDRGDLLLDRASLLRAPGLRRHLGFVPEAADPLPHLAVGELLALVAALRGAPTPPADRLERLGVAALSSRRLGALSLGQRRRCLPRLGTRRRPGAVAARRADQRPGGRRGQRAHRAAATPARGGPF
jgi:hypothetical protein